jgi:hypothetical protein
MPGPWDKRLSGGCQCGAVRYVLLAMPESACICHCRMCQKASGQPFMAFARTRSAGLQWTRGTPARFRSSNVVERGFCKDCGTPLTYQFRNDNVFVTLCSLDDPGIITPTTQFGVERELPWCSQLAALQRVRSDQDMSPDVAAGLVNHQHPDHDT